jgi:Lambda phage tail tube protein, TTP
MSDRTDTFYPAADAIHGYGSQLLVEKPGVGSPPVGAVWEAIAGVVSLTPGEMATEDIDRTHLRSPDAHREHMAGLRNSGPIVVQMIWLPTEESQSNAGGGTGPFATGGLIALWRDRTTHNFKIRLNDGSPGTEWPFAGYVSKFQPGEISAETKIDATAEFQPTQAYDVNLP